MGRRTLATGILVALALAPAARGDEPAEPRTPVELAAPFAARSPWRLEATHGPGVEDFGGNPAPGLLKLCLRKRPGAPCVDAPVEAAKGPNDEWAPHSLRAARMVHPNGPGAPPLLELVTASVSAGDGGQIVATQLLAYRRDRDAFERVFLKRTGTNNNQEVRFVEAGPLRGAVVSAEPTSDAPFGYWITVDRPTAAGAYRQALRYRSATRYNDGNPLKVIDSETPATLQRLGLWSGAGRPPTPEGRACPRPRLVKGELWCEAPPAAAG